MLVIRYWLLIAVTFFSLATRADVFYFESKNRMVLP